MSLISPFRAPDRTSLPARQHKHSSTSTPQVNWLFLDLNSYFASVEQEVRPELRNRPIAVVPSVVDTTCCIAASYEAKAYGVKTGTMVKEARELCPNIVLVEGRHELYTEYHNKIIDAVWSCLPVTAVRSVDEMVCQLIGRERELSAALDIARRIKQAIRTQVGSTLRCSIGLATNQYLAKVASDMEKPDGLIALTPEILRDALLTRKLQDLPGVGARTEKRLNARGIHSMADLLAVLDTSHGREATGDLWGSVWGERMWHWLNGDDLIETSNEHAKSMGHQHVLAPVFRTPEGAWAVAHKLLHKAAMRLRMEKLCASSLAVTVRYQLTKEQAEGLKTKRHFSGVTHSGWGYEARFAHCSDTLTLLEALRGCWEQRPEGAEFRKPFFVGVTLRGIILETEKQPTLFGDPDNRNELSATMDKLNQKYGHATLHFAGMLPAREAAPTRIAFTQIPVQYGVDYM